MTTRLRCFIIMPYSHESDLFYRSVILPVLKSLPDADILALRADEMGDRPLTLKAHVETAVQSADFCIVDLSGMNPNVLYELGYAMALSKPTIMLMLRDSGRPPANLAESKVLYYSPDEPDEFRESLARECSRIATATRRAREISTLETDASHIVLTDQSIGLAFDYLVQSVERDFAALVSSPYSLADIFFPKLKQRISTLGRGTIRVVCANPESGNVEARASILEQPLAIYRQKMWYAIKHLSAEFESLQGWSAELRLTDLFISSAIFLSDSMALFTPYMFVARSGKSFATLFDKGRNPEMFTLLQQEFDQTWETAVRSKVVSGRSVSTLPDDGT